MVQNIYCRFQTVFQGERLLNCRDLLRRYEHSRRPTKYQQPTEQGIKTKKALKIVIETQGKAVYVQ